MKIVYLSSRTGVFLGLICISWLFGWRFLAGTFQLSIKNDEYTHLLLILPITVAFILVESKLLSVVEQVSVTAGIALLGTAAIVAALTAFWPRVAPDTKLSLAVVALVTWWIGSFVLAFGTKVARFLLFPLGFLYGMVPLPDFAMNAIVRLLQQGSAFAARLLFEAAGVPVFQDGLLLTIPGLTVQVAKECSSIRSSLMLLVTTVVLAQLFLRSPLRKTFAVAIAIPLSVAKNGLRIFTIAMLGTRVDPGFLTGKLHHQGGIVFFAVSLAIVVVLVWWLERGERQSFRASPINALVSC